MREKSFPLPVTIRGEDAGRPEGCVVLPTLPTGRSDLGCRPTPITVLALRADPSSPTRGERRNRATLMQSAFALSCVAVVAEAIAAQGRGHWRSGRHRTERSSQI